MRIRLLRVPVLLLLAVAITLAVLYRDHFDAAALEAWIASAGATGPLLFMAVYAVATVLFLVWSKNSNQLNYRNLCLLL